MEMQLHPVKVTWKKETGKQVMDWGIKTLRVYEIWKQSLGENVKIAVLDTGIIDHPDLRENIKGRVNFSNSDRQDADPILVAFGLLGDTDDHGFSL